MLLFAMMSGAQAEQLRVINAEDDDFIVVRESGATAAVETGPGCIALNRWKDQTVSPEAGPSGHKIIRTPDGQTCIVDAIKATAANGIALTPLGLVAPELPAFLSLGQTVIVEVDDDEFVVEASSGRYYCRAASDCTGLEKGAQVRIFGGDLDDITDARMAYPGGSCKVFDCDQD